jgi:hypothetical protein
VSGDLRLELRVPGGTWWPFREFVERFYVPLDVEWRLAGLEESDDPRTFPVLRLPSHTHTVRFERGTELRLVVVREAGGTLPPLFPSGQEPRGFVAPVVAYGFLGAAVGLALAGEAWDAYRSWRHGWQVRRLARSGP